MPSMTPEEARELIETAKRISPRLDHDLPHLVDGKDIADMAETIAAMDYEYAVQYLTPDGWKYSRPSWENRWQDSEAVQEVRAYRDHPGQETRIVRRLVSQPEEVQP